MPPGAVMETPDQDLPWTVPDGQWEVHLQLTARRYPVLCLTASFSVSPADGFPAQHPDDRLLRLLRGEPFRYEQYSEGNLEQAARD